jgi:hypothetical protein
MKNLRLKLWHNILEDLGPPQDCILPAWLIAVRCIIFPVETPRFFFFERNGAFDVMLNQWTIHGVKYSDEFFRLMALSGGVTFRVDRVGDSFALTSLGRKGGLG